MAEGIFTDSFIIQDKSVLRNIFMNGYETSTISDSTNNNIVGRDNP